MPLQVGNETSGSGTRDYSPMKGSCLANAHRIADASFVASRLHFESALSSLASPSLEFPTTLLHWLTRFQIPEGQDTPCFAASLAGTPSFRARFLLEPCAGVAALSPTKPTTLLGGLVEETVPKAARLP